MADASSISVSALLTLVLWAQAGPQSSPPSTTSASDFTQHLALTRARHEILRQVQALPLPRGTASAPWPSDTTVERWAARNPARDRALRRFIESLPPCQPPSRYRDLSCDVVVVLTPQALYAQLQQLDYQYPAVGPASGRLPDAAEAISNWPVLWAVGTACPGEQAASSGQDGWEDVRAEAMEAIGRAATADARHALLESVKNLPATRARKVREFLDADPQIAKTVLEAFEPVAQTTVSFEPGHIACAVARIDSVRLIEILTDACRRYYRGDLFNPQDFGQMALLLPATEISAVGVAFPAHQMLLAPPIPPCGEPTPDWAELSLTATGVCPPADARRLGPEAAAQAARRAALAHLTEQAKTLALVDGRTVGTLLADHPGLQLDLTTFIEGACPLSGPSTTADGAVEMSVALSARRLWLILCTALSGNSAPGRARQGESRGPETEP
jgi:hypothetical protein